MSLTESIVKDATLTWFGELVPQARKIGQGVRPSRTLATAGLPKVLNGELSAAGAEKRIAQAT